MRLPLNAPSPLPSLTLIELNGTVHLPPPSSTSKLSSEAGVELGKFTLNSGGSPTLVIGSHVVTGKAVEVSKPYLLCRRQGSVGSKRKRGGSGEEDDEGGGSGIEVVGVVTKKYLFDAYPKTITRAIA